MRAILLPIRGRSATRTVSLALEIHESFRQEAESKIMVYRPRTKLVKSRKEKRCPKCGVLVGMRKRCKTCHKKLVA